MKKIQTLFLCTGNSCRSQMAEGWMKYLKEKYLEPFCAGVKPKKINPNAVKVMAESEVDISGQQSKHFDEFKDVSLDWIIVVCVHLHETCLMSSGRAKVGRVGANRRKSFGLYYRRARDENPAFIEKPARGSFQSSMKPLDG